MGSNILVGIMARIRGKSGYDKDAGGGKRVEIMRYIIHKIHGRRDLGTDMRG